MKTAPIQARFFYAIKRSPAFYGGDWYLPEQAISDTMDDALNEAVQSLEANEDYCVREVCTAEGTDRDVTEDAWRGCSWTHEPPLPLASEREEAEREAEEDASEWQAHFETERRILERAQL